MIKKVTVIIPTYKRPRLLIRCLQAIAAQQIDKSDYMVIVVSDGPDELTKDAIETWKEASNISLSFLQIDKKGPAAARNHGWKQAITPLIAFTDDDCIPSPHWLSAIVNAYSGQDLIAFTGRTVVPLPAKKTDFALNLSQLEKSEFITANCACTRAALELVGGFDERFEMAWREDSDLQFKLMVHGIEIMQIGDALVVHPVREVPWGISIKEQKKGLYDALLFKKYPDLYRKKINSSINRYYLMMLVLGVLLWSMIKQYNYITAFTAIMLVLLFARFIAKRLQDRHKSFNQVTDMIITSLVIPFLSIFWRIYGSVKYRILFL
jgi:glycosyltransferase involved in cell wall biosynthesis